MKRFAAAIAILLLSGCAASELSETLAPTAEATESATPTLSELEISFDDVAIASCDKAMLEGVEESLAGGVYRQVMIPKDRAIDGYSAAWEDSVAGEVGLIWEADAFLSCSAAMTIWLAAEAGEEPIWEIAEIQDGFELFQDFGEFGTQTIRFEVSEGLFVAAEIDGGDQFIIRYAPEIAAGQELISLALQDFGG